MIGFLARTVLLVMILLSPAGCDGEFDPDPPGPTGYVSDRAAEYSAEVRGPLELSGVGLASALGRVRPQPFEDRVRAALLRVDDELAAGGQPLDLARAPRAAAPDGGGGFRATVQGWARLPAAGGWPRAFPEGTIATRAAEVRLAALAPRGDRGPALAAAAADGVVAVSALFGQMGTEALSAADDAWRSRERLESALRAAGFEEEATARGATSDERRWSARVDGALVVVRVSGPESLRLDAGDDALRARLRDAVAASDVVYLDAHAFQPCLDVLADPATFPPDRPRLLVLDLCWSYQLYVAPALRAAPPGLLQVVSSADRVTTGSVDSFLLLLWTLLDGADVSWVDVTRAMNDASEERAVARRAEGVEPKFARPELYGVSGL